MDEAPILVDKREGYRLVTLNRPQRLNAFNEAMHRALKIALDEAEMDESCRALLLTGAGRGFCAGQDLGDRVQSGDTKRDLGKSLDTYYNPLIRKLRGLPFPVVAAVNASPTRMAFIDALIIRVSMAPPRRVTAIKCRTPY